MDFFSIAGAILGSWWGVLAAAVLLLVLAWLVGGLLGRIVDAALRRVPIIRLIFRHIDDRDEVVLRLRIRQGVRLLVMAAAAWGGWSYLRADTAIAAVVEPALATVRAINDRPGLALLLEIAVVVTATWLLLRGIRWVRAITDNLRRRIDEERGRKLSGLRFQRLQVLSAEQETGVLRVLTKYARYLVDLVLIIVYLIGVFSVFPQTRTVVLGILQGVLRVLGEGWQNFVSYLPNLVNLAVIAAVTYYSLRVLRFIFNEVGKATITFPGFHPEWAIPTFQLVRVAAIALALVIAFPYLPGSSSPAFQGVSLFIGALLSLGSTSIVANIVSGVVLTYTRAFRVGDRVKIADTVGDVTEKALLVTRVRTIKNVEVTIPNSLVLQSHIVNYSGMAHAQGLILNLTLTLGYDIPWRKVHEALIDAAKRTKGILPHPPPFVFQLALDDSWVQYELNAYTDKANEMHIIYSDLNQSVQDSCNEAGIEILSPRFAALRDGNRSTVPADSLPKNYRPPGFGVKLDSERS
jgi:small-conductance mechanosensitive channel